MVWHFFAPDDVGGQARHLVSVLTIVYPHFLALPGLALLIAGQRMSRQAFVAIALVPFVYTIACLGVRFGNL